MARWAERVNFIYELAEVLRGDYRRSENGRVILPFVLLRRLDCVLEPTKNAVLAVYEHNKGGLDKGLDLILRRAAKQPFYNVSSLNFERLLGDAPNVRRNLIQYINGFSPGAVDVLEHYKFTEQIDRLDGADLLYLLVAKFADVDLHPDVVSNTEMGHIFEELIRRFSEQSNEAAGEHFTPREVVRLKVELLFAPDSDDLKVAGSARTLYDPAAGTGGMLSVAEDYLRELNEDARLHVFGQELNDESYAICRSDMMLKGQDPSRIAPGNSLSRDAFPTERFDYMVSNPPYGVKWTKIQQPIRDEAERLGMDGRFGAGLPSVKDGSLLFLQHMLSKMKPATAGGSRISIVFNESPLFKGAAGGGESRIRGWILENDWLEAVVALPEQLFYNTGIYTYIWVVTNRKRPERQGKVQLLDARELWERLPKSLGEKRRRLSNEHIAKVVSLYSAFEQTEGSQVLDNEEFKYRRLAIEAPLRVRYAVTTACVAQVQDSKPFIKLAVPTKNGEDVQAQMATRERAQRTILDRLGALVGMRADTHAELEDVFDAVWVDVGVRVPKAVKDSIWEAAMVRAPNGELVTDSKGRPKPDKELRDVEEVPYRAEVEAYMDEHVRPELPGAWVDEKKTRIGYAILVTRRFYRAVQQASIDELDSQLRTVEGEIVELLQTASDEALDAMTPDDGPRRPSELAWLPTVPEHWEVVKLSRVAQLGSGHTPSRKNPEYWENCTIPWITTGEVAQVRDDRQDYILETRERISELGVEKSAAVVHPKDTVVLSRTASAGFSAIMGDDMATSQDFVTWTCSPRLRPRFLLLCLRAMREDLLGRLAMGSTHKTIYMPDIEALRIPLPPEDEQDVIVALVAERTQAIDALVDRFQLQLELLGRRRRALMQGAVAGELHSRSVALSG